MALGRSLANPFCHSHRELPSLKMATHQSSSENKLAAAPDKIPKLLTWGSSFLGHGAFLSSVLYIRAVFIRLHADFSTNIFLPSALTMKFLLNNNKLLTGLFASMKICCWSVMSVLIREEWDLLSTWRINRYGPGTKTNFVLIEIPTSSIY